MKRRTRVVVAGAAIVAAGLIGSGVAVAASSGGDDNSTAITGEALTRASAVALDHTGGGKVTGTEVGDEESYYEVEVTKSDGTQTDVQLDKDFKVVGGKVDHESEGTHEGPAGDGDGEVNDG